ncbi:HTH-type transcriptional regulator LrpC [Calidithermus terrae]|uniref:HTH-type transcriptional regulator LrpC n=1 Tax=Calidithermus terrae TaxID=1408545 RepID=A0A399EJL4_9DEIN|nr:Lrp/AsnC family transcriptional regulator [Calidithermus terrae]RIH82542.1 HTH-type transcriptional regulator LrpC [Calidithermus terrae]
MSRRKKSLDSKDLTILRALRENARLPYKELAERLGMAVPSAIERVRRLEDAGVITGYRAEVDPAALGLPVAAWVRLSDLRGDPEALARALPRMPEVQQAYRSTGDACYVLLLRVASLEHLERLLDSLGRYGQTHTALVVSAVLEGPTLPPPGD